MCVALFGVCTRLVSPTFGAISQNALRFAGGALVLIGCCLFAGFGLRLLAESIRYTLLLAVGMAGVAVTFTYAVQRSPLGQTISVLFAASMITGFLIAWLAQRKHPTLPRCCALTLALAGLATYSGFDLTMSVGLAAALAAGVFDALSHAVRTKLRSYNTRLVAMWCYAFAAPLTLGAAILSGESVRFDAIDAGVVLGMPLYVGATAALSLLLLIGFRHVDLNRGTVLLATQVLFGQLLGAGLLDEPVRGRSLIGSLLIFAASSYSVFDARRSARHGGAIAEADVTISITPGNEKGAECPAASNSDPAHAVHAPVSFVRRPARPGSWYMRGSA